MEAGGSSRARAVWFFFFFFFFFVTVVNARRSTAGGAGRNGVVLAGYLGGLPSTVVLYLVARYRMMGRHTYTYVGGYPGVIPASSFGMHF